MYINEKLLKKPENGPKIRDILEQVEIDIGEAPEQERGRLLRSIKDDLGEEQVYNDIMKRLG